MAKERERERWSEIERGGARKMKSDREKGRDRERGIEAVIIMSKTFWLKAHFFPSYHLTFS